MNDNPIYTANLALIERRWPQLAAELERAGSYDATLEERGSVASLIVDGIHLSSSFDPMAEAIALAKPLLQQERTAQQLYVYGENNGAVIDYLLEQTANESKLILVLMNLRLFNLYATHYDFSRWLNQSRVDLTVATADEQLRYPFATAPSALRFENSRCPKLYRAIQTALNDDYVTQNMRSRDSQYLEQIAQNRPFLEQDARLPALLRQIGSKRAHVIGAGPTLADHFEPLKAVQGKETIIAVDTSLKTLDHAGIVPDVAVVIEANLDIIRAFADLSTNMRQTRLLYFPAVPIQVLNVWLGQRYWGCSNSVVYQQAGFNNRAWQLFSSGSVIHPAIDLAVKAGAKEVVFYGTDFGYYNDQSHVNNSDFSHKIVTHVDWVINGYGERIGTLPNLKSYLSDLESYIALKSKVKFFNSDRRGAKIEGCHYFE
ncbi:DUF115 domain-containing protein [Ectothiorhodospiraceae bacterium BW-2]|nr:DUF115 domain-containing protein [Ectothiorhodospiraceae bacterium BW-2]